MSFCYLTYNHLRNSILHISFICLTPKNHLMKPPQIARGNSPASSIGLKKSLVLMQPLWCLKPLHLFFLSPTWGNPNDERILVSKLRALCTHWLLFAWKLLVKLVHLPQIGDENRTYLRNHHQVIEAKLREGFKVFPYRMKVAWSRATTQIVEMSS